MSQKIFYNFFPIVLFTLLFTENIKSQTPIVICPQNASFTGMTRGYHFTAPTNFTICGLFVEDDMSTAFQSVAIVKFNSAAPPAYPGTTNGFVTLFQDLNWVPNTMIPVPNIIINTGDIIGVYGSRTANSINSYGAANCPITIQGFPVNLQRSGMQFDLAAGPGMHDIWSEVNYNIGRITMYTNCCVAPIPIPSITGDTVVCTGDTLTYTVPAQSGALSYNWTVPTGATIISGQNSTTINVLWNSAPGGQVCVDWTDSCTTSTPTCFNVTVNPTPTMTQPANATYCNGDPVPISAFVSNPTGGNFAWTNSAPSIGLAANGIGNTPAFNATNLGLSPVTATITVVPELNGCVGIPISYTITVNPTPAAPTASSINICSNSDGTLTATAPGGNYEWFDAPTGGTLLSTGASYTTPILTVNTTYYVQTTINGCVSPRTPVSVSIAPLPVFTITGGGKINIGESTTLSVIPGVSGTTYSWSPPFGLSCIFCQSTVASPTASTWYYVTVTNAGGCKIVDSVFVEVDPSTNIYIPNIFSPNNDGNNDIYLVNGKGVDLFQLQIFNRWGQLIFESKDIDKGWDGTKNGKELNQGTFVYKLNVTFYDGGKVEKTGNITLVR